MKRFFCSNVAKPQPAKRAPKPFDRVLRQRQDASAERLCPITLENVANYPAQDCVIFIDGHVYQRAALLTWLNQHATVPTTNQNLSAFAKQYGIALRTPHEALLARTDHQLFWLHVALYFTLSMIALGTFVITAEKPLPNKTAQHIVSSISLSVMFFATAYLMLYITLTCRRHSSKPVEAILPPLLLNDASVDLFDRVQRHYQAFMLPYDPEYFVRPPAATLDFPS